METGYFNYEEAKRLIDRHHEIIDLCDTRIRELERVYSRVDGRRDLRLTALGRFSGTLQSTVLGLHHLRHNLLDPAWWDRHCLQLADLDQQSRRKVAADHTRLFEEFLKISSSSMVFVAVESTLRMLARSLGLNGEQPINKLYRRLLIETLPRLDRFIPCLDLFRLIRNTLHNNGVYYDPRAADAEVEWEGKFFAFRHGGRVEFASWDLILDMERHLVELLAAVAAHPTVIGIADEVLDVSLPEVDY